MLSKKLTIGNYLLRRLKSLGADIIFGVPDDYNLQFLDQIEVLFNENSRYGLKLNTFDFNNVITNSSALYLGAHKIEEIGDYNGNVSVQKKFLRKEFNFGLQERLTGTDMPVEESDFKIESFNITNSNIKCVSFSNLQRFVFGEQYLFIDQDYSIEPTPSKRLKSSSTNEKVRSGNMKKKYLKEN
ncbi:unnamed protein product [Rotaria sp. Silwood2]|nr:unnamed protein product [Rotaria sp. Silwood2]CAF4472603.1 unnamed protein product [Rotaria sp. Silwood2]